MAEKALAHPLVAKRIGSVYQLRCDVIITDGDAGNIHSFSVFPESASFVPLLGWKPLIRAAVISYAAATYGLTVDQVMLGDLSLLGL